MSMLTPTPPGAVGSDIHRESLPVSANTTVYFTILVKHNSRPQVGLPLLEAHRDVHQNAPNSKIAF